GIARAIDLAHPALANLREHHVRAEAPAWCESQRARNYIGGAPLVLTPRGACPQLFDRAASFLAGEAAFASRRPWFGWASHARPYERLPDQGDEPLACSEAVLCLRPIFAAV